MMTTRTFLVPAAAAVLSLAACSPEGQGSEGPLNEDAVQEHGNVAEETESNVSVPERAEVQPVAEAGKAAASREENRQPKVQAPAKSRSEAPVESKETPVAETPPADPHAGHDMNHMG